MRFFTLVISLTALAACVSSQTIADRLACTGNVAQPETRVNTTGRLVDFRTALGNLRVNNREVVAFIVGSGDAHNSEYPTEYDQRRGYISGFTGSAGTAVITQDKAALWTDGRYYDEADEALDCNWILMKDGLSDTPTIAEWINSEMTGSGSYVGIDTVLVTNSYFQELEAELVGLSNRAELRALSSAQNPVDTIWTTDRTPQPNATINALKTAFAGLSWQDKVTNLRANMTSKGADAFVVTALDEIAWLFNLRGSDVNYNPFFLSYATVRANDVTLYILAKDFRLTATPTDNETETNLATHLATGSTGSCAGITVECVEVKTYDQTQFETDLGTLANTGTVWVSHDANYAVYTAVQNNRVVDKSPIALTKSIKNDVEQAGMKRAYDRDSVALIKFLAFLEQEIKVLGNTWDEVSAGAELDRRRSQLQYYRGLSFETISGYGRNGAIIHYRPSALTNLTIGTDSLYLLDSGALYLDGTTDVTRTMFYGTTPTDYQKECYTRVLMGAIDLATFRWPEGLYGFQIDSAARGPLWDAGLVYNHGTGHGIGAYLGVHEGPGTIRQKSSASSSEETLTGYQYYSDEPGYYETNNFGIRLETIVMIQPFTPAYSTSGLEFYEFTPITLVPFENNLIDYSLMTTSQVNWLNTYNTKIRDEILPMLEGDQVAINWVNERIQSIDSSITCNMAGKHVLSTASWLAAIFVAFITKQHLL